MSCATTFIVGSDTGIRVLPGAHLANGRAVIVVVSEGLTIIARRWEDLQRLVLALHDGIAEARQAEDAAASAAFSSDDIGTPASMRVADVASTQARTQRFMAGTAQDLAAQDRTTQRFSDEVAAAEEELLEAGGLRVRLQREAREQLRAQGVPLCRATVTVRACALLHAQWPGDIPRTAPVTAPSTPPPAAAATEATLTEPTALTEPAGDVPQLRRERAADIGGSLVDTTCRDLKLGRLER